MDDVEKLKAIDLVEDKLIKSFSQLTTRHLFMESVHDDPVVRAGFLPFEIICATEFFLFQNIEELCEIALEYTDYYATIENRHECCEIAKLPYANISDQIQIRNYVREVLNILEFDYLYSELLKTDEILYGINYGCMGCIPRAFEKLYNLNFSQISFGAIYKCNFKALRKKIHIESRTVREFKTAYAILLKQYLICLKTLLQSSDTNEKNVWFGNNAIEFIDDLISKLEADVIDTLPSIALEGVKEESV